MFEVRQTEGFARWIDGLADRDVAGRIAKRIVRLQAGLFGDVKSVGGGVSELRIDHGPGYRVYFARRGRRILLLLSGGDKRTQERDIDKAKTLAAQMRD